MAKRFEGHPEIPDDIREGLISDGLSLSARENTNLTLRRSEYIKANNSYSGADIRAIVNVGGKIHLFGNLQTISYSIHRDKLPVRTLGRTYPKGYVRGPRTIAGSLIFTVFDKHVLYEVLQYHKRDNPEFAPFTPLSDMIPPFDVTIIFDNEHGQQSSMRIYGLEIIDEGQTMSIDDMITENVMSYVARNIQLMATSRSEAYGPDGEEGKILSNVGLFLDGSLDDPAAINRVQNILNKVSDLQLELVGGPGGNNVPSAVRESEIRSEITYLRSQLEGGISRVSSGTEDRAARFNTVWDFRTMSSEFRFGPRNARTQPHITAKKLPNSPNPPVQSPPRT